MKGERKIEESKKGPTKVLSYTMYTNTIVKIECSISK
jgi:hypothetical protein